MTNASNMTTSTGNASGLAGFDITQRFLIEQTLNQIYKASKARIALALQKQTGQLMPPYIQQLLGSLDRLSIVEVNCGYGFLSNYVSLLCPKTRVIGIEANIEKTACARASIGNRQNIRFIREEFGKIPKIEADLIILHLDTLDEHARVQLQRAYQWLNPGGDLLVCTQNPKAQWKRFLSMLTPDMVLRWLKRDPSLDATFLASETTRQWQEGLVQARYAPLAEYDATRNHAGFLGKLLSYLDSQIWYHAEKPLFDNSKAIQFNNGNAQNRLKPMAPLERLAASMAEMANANPMPERKAAKPYATHTAQKQAMPTHQDDMQHKEPDEVLEYIFSKQWQCLSKEI